MAQPFPPAGNQSSHTERPLKVYAEQYHDGAALPVGAVINPEPIPGMVLFNDGVPRVALPLGWVPLTPGDWVLSNRYTGKPTEVISAEEFAERFGPTEDPGVTR